MNPTFGILIILIICIFWFWYMLANPPNLLKVNYEKINFKTGDIILFHAFNNINPVFIGSYWGHIGIVFVNPDEPNSKPLLFEAAQTSSMKCCPEYNKPGIMITDLKTRLEKYPGITAVKILAKPINTELIRGMKEFMKYSKKNMFYNDNVIINGIKKKFGERLNNGTNCGEIVFLSLIKLGLIDPNEYNHNIAHHLLYMVHIKKLINNKYHNPIEILFNPF